MSPRATVRACAVTLVVVLSLGACGGGGGKQQTASDKAKETATAGNGAAAGAEGGGGSAESSTTIPRSTGSNGGGAGSSAATDGSESTTPAGAEKGPERTDIPLPGRYTYSYTTPGSSSERILDVHDTSERRGNVRQIHYFGAGTSVVASVVVWFGTTLYYTESEQRARDREQSAICVWDPGFVQLELPLQVGKTWKADSKCSQERASRRRTLEASVKGTEEVEVGGRRIRVFTIEKTQVTTSVAKAGDVTVTTVDRRITTDKVSADRHTLVRSEGTEETTLNGAPNRLEKFTLVLNSLDPKPIPGSNS